MAEHTHKLFLLRHGQSIANVTEDHDTPDPVLSELGQKQAESWRGQIGQFGAEVALISPLKRAVQTACLALADEKVPMELCRCAKELHVLEPESTPGSEDELREKLREWPRGLEIQKVTEEMKRHAKDRDARANVKRLKAILRTRSKKSILVVCHGALIRELCGLSETPANCQILECELTLSRVRLVGCHRPEERSRAGLVSAIKAVEKALTMISRQQADLQGDTMSFDETWMMKLNQDLAESKKLSPSVENVLANIPQQLLDGTGNIVCAKQEELRMIHDMLYRELD